MFPERKQIKTVEINIIWVLFGTDLEESLDNISRLLIVYLLLVTRFTLSKPQVLNFIYLFLVLSLNFFCPVFSDNFTVFSYSTGWENHFEFKLIVINKLVIILSRISFYNSLLAAWGLMYFFLRLDLPCRVMSKNGISFCKIQ